MLSPDGRSYSYDTRANGFGRGEGAACVLVKRLADAVRDGDSIRAIIRNTAASHSGKTNGITMPSQAAQVQLLTRLHQEVGLDPKDTGYVEVSNSSAILVSMESDYKLVGTRNWNSGRVSTWIELSRGLLLNDVQGSNRCWIDCHRLRGIQIPSRSYLYWSTQVELWVSFRCKLRCHTPAHSLVATRREQVES